MEKAMFIEHDKAIWMALSCEEPLDNYRNEILKYLKKGINKRAISKLIECSPSTLYEWLRRRKPSAN